MNTNQKINFNITNETKITKKDSKPIKLDRLRKLYFVKIKNKQIHGKVKKEISCRKPKWSTYIWKLDGTPLNNHIELDWNNLFDFKNPTQRLFKYDDYNNVPDWLESTIQKHFKNMFQEIKELSDFNLNSRDLYYMTSSELQMQCILKSWEK